MNGIQCNSLNESFKSKKLQKFAKEHGGLVQGNWSSSFDNDLFNMTDDDFDQYVQVNQDEHYRRYGFGGWDKNSPFTNNNFQPLEFKDGTFLVRKDPESAYGQKSRDVYHKRLERGEGKKGDGAKEYQYENPYLHGIVNDTDFKPRGNWGFKGEGDLNKQNLNPKAIKQKHILQTYDDAFKKADDLAAGKFKEKDDDNNIINKTKTSSKRNVKKSEVNEEFKSKSKYMMSKLCKQIVRAMASYIQNKEDEGMSYTKEDILTAVKPTTDRLAKMNSAVTVDLIIKCLNFYLEKHYKNLNFLIENKKRTIKVLLKENDIEKIIAESIKRVLTDFNC